MGFLHGGGRSSNSLGLGQSARILDLVENFQSLHGAMLFGILLVATHTGVLSSINFTSQGEDNIGGHPGGSNHGEGNSPAQFVQKLNWVPFSWVIRHFLSLLGFLGSLWHGAHGDISVSGLVGVFHQLIRDDKALSLPIVEQLEQGQGGQLKPRCLILHGRLGFWVCRNNLDLRFRTFLGHNVLDNMLGANVFGDLLRRSSSRKGLALNHALSSEKMRNSRSQHAGRSVNKSIIDPTNNFVQYHQRTLGSQDLPQTEVHALLADCSGNGLLFLDSAKFSFEKAFLSSFFNSSVSSKSIIHNDVSSESGDRFT